MPNYKIENLRPLEYMGRHKDLELDAGIGLRTRLSAIDFSGEYEVFAPKCDVFTRLFAAIPMRIHSVHVAPNHLAEEYTGWAVQTLTDDVNEKITQWASVAQGVLARAGELEEQFGSNPTARFNYFAPIRILESEVEHYCFKIVSILDLYARIAHVFNSQSPEKFGQQVAKSRRGETWDADYQHFLVGCEALVALRDYRNALGHEVSLKLRPAKHDGIWRPVLVETYGDRTGFLLCPFLSELRVEILRYTDFFDSHFEGKAPSLGEFLADNAL